MSSNGTCRPCCNATRRSRVSSSGVSSSVMTDNDRPFERVHTMTDYYDGPRRGIADYDGTPHLYESLFDEDADGYGDVFELRRVDDETFRIAIEDWQIWLRWDD